MVYFKTTVLTVAGSWQNMLLRSNTRCVFPISKQGRGKFRSHFQEREDTYRTWCTSCCPLIMLQLKCTVSLPSSSVQWCWERSWPGRCTQTRVTPQNATDGTGKCACSGACNGSGAWHWWQSLCTPSEIQKTGETVKNTAHGLTIHLVKGVL